MAQKNDFPAFTFILTSCYLVKTVGVGRIRLVGPFLGFIGKFLIKLLETLAFAPHLLILLLHLREMCFLALGVLSSLSKSFLTDPLGLY
jgi:hypothetical protein